MGNERAKVVIYDKIIKLLYANTAINLFLIYDQRLNGVLGAVTP